MCSFPSAEEMTCHFHEASKGFWGWQRSKVIPRYQGDFFFSFTELDFQQFLKKKKIIYTSDHQPFPEMSPALQKGWEYQIKRNFQGAAIPVKPQVPPKTATTPPHLTKAAPWVPLFPSGIIYPHLSLQTSHGIETEHQFSKNQEILDT